MKMFKRGDIVQVKPEFCDVGEDDFKYRIIEWNDDRGLIVDLDSPFPIAPQQLIQQHMIELCYPQRG
jgi:hypothetical protein